MRRSIPERSPGFIQRTEYYEKSFGDLVLILDGESGIDQLKFQRLQELRAIADRSEPEQAEFGRLLQELNGIAKKLKLMVTLEHEQMEGILRLGYSS